MERFPVDNEHVYEKSVRYQLV